MSVALGLLAVLGLTFGTGYFVAAEFAFVAARRSRLEEMASGGDRKAALAVAVQRRLSFVLSGAQLGITVTSLAVGFIAEPVFAAALAPLLGPLRLGEAAMTSIAITVGLVISTVIQMVLGELGPKNLAIANPEPMARALAASTALYTRVAGPVIRLFDESSNRLLRAVGIEPVEELPAGVSEDELEVIIDESESRGELGGEQAALLSRALGFRTRRAGEAMVPRPAVVGIRGTATCEELRALAVSSGHSRFLVFGDNLDDVRGVVQAKDVLGVPVDERGRTGIAGLIRPVLAVPESARLGRLLSKLREAHSQLALVVDEYGGTAGIVTLEDIVEEIVGEIRDEHDPSDEPAVRPVSGGFLVPGSWRLDETERDTGVTLPRGDYETVAGLVLARLGSVPEVGSSITVGGASLRVEAMDGHAIRSLLLELQESK
ncbi:MAG: hemolysin family protein [Egibacteraceae bacterium]